MVVLEQHQHAARQLDDFHRERMKIDARSAGRIALVDQIVGLGDGHAARAALRLRGVELRLAPRRQLGQLLAERVDGPLGRTGHGDARPHAAQVGVVLARRRELARRAEAAPTHARGRGRRNSFSTHVPPLLVDQHGTGRIDDLRDVHHRRAVARRMTRERDAVAGLQERLVPLDGPAHARETVRARELAAPLHFLTVVALDRQ